ncbi:uncharacterized protein LOC130994088 [Salvia miltiorrhiza]|uniref:uncharacterized protein LOC130994088 n=1 Tax=Salvia miltiorrhiza TaxID=226208 RepID=UPI0025ABBA5B|nr:uncharacterized protein LOC130994088 [Salvia miltiorrhiza]
MTCRPAALADFPFKLQHTPSDRERITLTRELDGEEIKVTLLGNDQNQNDCSDSDEESPARSAIDLIIEISKPNGKSMKFFAAAFAHKIEVQRLIMRSTSPSFNSQIAAEKGGDDNEEDEDFELSLVRKDFKEFSAEDFVYDGKLGLIFPVFNCNLLLRNGGGGDD